MTHRFVLVALCALIPRPVAAEPPAPRHHHGHGHHRFKDPERWAKVLEGPGRDRWQRPEKVIARLGLTSGMKVAEIGSGTGYFAVRIARQLPRSKVYAIDVEPAMVRYLAKRAARERLPRLVSRLGAFDDPRIPEPVDVVFLCNTYHHIEGRTAYFKRVARSLRPGGRLVVVDFKRGKLPVGPPEAMRVKPRRLDRELAAAGYRRISLDTEALPYQYIAIYARAGR